MYKFLTGALAALALYGPSCTYAENNTADEIVVTAVRTAQTADETLASVSVIDRREIESTQAETLVELLQHYAGIDAVRTGGPAQQTSIFMRGTNSDHTLVMIDGVPVSSINTGAYQWENLPLYEVERIEIVRGPRSAIYGSEALGGVIQVFTRRNREIIAETVAGSFDTYGASISGGFGGNTTVRVNASHKQAEGFTAKDTDPDNDGYIHKSVGIGLATSISDSTSVEINARQSQLDNEYDTGTSNTRQDLINTQLNFAPSLDTAYRITAASYQDVLTSYGSFSSSRITSRRLTAGLLSQHHFGTAGKLVLGIDHRTDQGVNFDIGGSSTVFDNQVNNTGSFISWHKPRPSGSLELAARADIHSQFGNHVTGQAAWGRNLSSGHKLYISAGTGFKAPDLHELYHPGYSGTYAGNSNLQPEQSRSMEIGFKQTANKNRHSASLFYNQVDNLIAYQGINNQAINVSRALTYGLELAIARRLDNWLVDGQLTLQRAIDESDGSALLRRANEKLSLRATRQLTNNDSAMIEAVVSGGSVDFGPVTLGAYSVINAAYSRTLGTNWILSARFNNLLNRKYVVADGYNTTPRSFLLNLRYQAK